MEFGEKLQELRKSKGMTQEELAEQLYVSRTAVSKWESGRGLPNIDSLKQISEYFSVSIDDLLSGDRLITLAEKENRQKINNMCQLLSGITDLFHFLLIVLPLYPKTVEGYVYSVNLFSYMETSLFNSRVYLTMFIILIVVGIVRIGLNYFGIAKHRKTAEMASILLSTVAVIALALGGETYAVITVFLLLAVKGLLLFKSVGNN